MTTAAIDLRLVVNDAPVGTQPEKVKCREHADKTESLAVYDDHLHCFGCGFHLNSTVESLAYLLKTDGAGALEVSERYTNDSIDRYRERAASEARRDPLPGSLAVIYHETLMAGRRQQRKTWFAARGLDGQTLSAFALGHDGLRFTIPVYDTAGNLISIRYRLDPAYADADDIRKHKYLGMKGRNGLYLYPEYSVSADDRDYIVLCEGELDALRLWQSGIPAVTVTNGAGQTHKLPELLRMHYPRLKHLVIATDQDEAGDEAARVTTSEAQEMGFTTTRLAWDEGPKDVTEALQLGALDADALYDDCECARQGHSEHGAIGKLSHSPGSGGSDPARIPLRGGRGRG